MCLATAGFLLTVDCSAAQDRLIVGGKASDLPSLPGEARTESRDALAVDDGTIALRERGFDDTLGVRLDGYQAYSPSVAVEKGWLVNSRLAVGGVYTVGSGSTELLLNGVYAPRQDFRVQLSASQLRADSLASSYNGDRKTVLQTGYLSSVRKRWDKSRLRPELSAAIFAARAAGAAHQDVAVDGLETGTLAGSMVKLAIGSMQRERVELSYRTQSVVYDNPHTVYWRERQVSSSVDYARTFDDCSQFRGRYSGGPDMSEAELRYERGAFSIGLMQTMSNEYSDSAIRVGYTVSLGRGGQSSTRCSIASGRTSPFRNLVDAVTIRSPYLPEETLVRTAESRDAPG